ncbi:MAG: type II secretion system major pseudopilin GspG [Planctomycetaceae bacterium]|nr:type II secretion system major pseudopilin GspG [Planctomycetaceae bacterium]
MEKNRQDQCRKRVGFTLLEVMIVLFILVTLAAMAIVAVTGTQKKAQQRAAFTYVKLLDSAVKRYMIDVGRPPESLDQLVNPPDPKGGWGGPYIEDTATNRDPWGNEYQYATPGTRTSREYEIWSFGPDGINGTDDDIGSWMPSLDE